jgi:hypothetical protein
MAESTVTHSESWEVMITPGKDEVWPDHKIRYSRATVIRPDRIRVTIRSGVGIYSGSVTGSRVLKDGTLGVIRRSDLYYSSSEFPDWAQNIIERELAKHNVREAT